MQNNDMEKIVSKFDITYILGGIAILVIPLWVAFMFCFNTGNKNYDYEFYTEDIITFLFVAAIIFTIYFLTLGKFVRISATESFIYLDNLLTRQSDFISFDEIKEIKESIDITTSKRMAGHYLENTTLQLILKNGNIIFLDDYAYSNFMEVGIFIYENFKKITFNEQQKLPNKQQELLINDIKLIEQ